MLKEEQVSLPEFIRSYLLITHLLCSPISDLTGAPKLKEFLELHLAMVTKINVIML